jgi:hypothetical protein
MHGAGMRSYALLSAGSLYVRFGRPLETLWIFGGVRITLPFARIARWRRRDLLGAVVTPTNEQLEAWFDRNTLVCAGSFKGVPAGAIVDVEE